jgi:WD40 repeat protein
MLATGGSDGKIKIWKTAAQNIYELLYTFQHDHIPITTMKFLDMGLYIAYTIGNDWSQGPN